MISKYFNIYLQLFSFSCFALLITMQLQGQTEQVLIDVQQISSTPWNTPDGIVYTQVPGANLGATSFEVLGIGRIAFLCNSTSEIIVVNTADGRATQRFPVAFAPRDFVFDKGVFYVLSQLQVDVYDENGKAVSSFTFPQTYAGVERLARSDGSTWLLLPSGNSARIETNGQVAEPQEVEGWITASGVRIVTKLSGFHTYNIMLISANGLRSDCTFETEKPVAGVYPVGVTENRVYLDVQTFISESPVSVERKIEAIEIEASTMKKKAAEIRIPDVYYVLSNKDFTVSSEGILFNMITDEQGVFVFSLAEKVDNKGIIRAYPDILTKKAYHFNDHLITTEQE